LRLNKTGLSLFLLPVIISGLLLLLPGSATEVNMQERLMPPSWNHPMGTDFLGRDVAKRVALGVFISLALSFMVVAITSLLGTALGSLSGMVGGVLDEVLMRAVDLLLAFPGFLLALTFVALLGGGFWNLILALSFSGWTSYCRLSRGIAIKLREEDFITSSLALGASYPWIFLHHTLPHVLPVIRVQATVSMAGVILAESSLSFLGLGLQPPTPSLGGMIDAGRGFLLQAPWLSLFPGLFLFFMIMGLLMMAEEKKPRDLFFVKPS